MTDHKKPKVGFHTMTPDKHHAASVKGGQAKTEKGFAKLSPEERSRIGREAIAKRWAKRGAK